MSDNFISSTAMPADAESPSAASAAQPNARPDARYLQECMGRSLEQLSDAFRASARRWELIVYPALIAFVILAGYGFYLVYSLTKDVHLVAAHMEAITKNMDAVAQQMEAVSANMNVVAGDIHAESKTMEQMTAHLEGMNDQMRQMNFTVDQMRYHFAVMNRTVGRPMSFMNSFMPW